MSLYFRKTYQKEEMREESCADDGQKGQLRGPPGGPAVGVFDHICGLEPLVAWWSPWALSQNSDLKCIKFQRSHCGAVETTLTSIYEDLGSVPGLAQWVGEPALLWAVVEVADMAWIASCLAVAVV